jgi:hypothetical protein
VALLVLFITLIFPVVAPVGTATFIDVGETMVKDVAFMSLNCTSVVSLKPEPDIVTTVPARPLTGKKLFIFGRTVKLLSLVLVPLEVVTLMEPVIAVAGTIALMVVGEMRVKDALTPPNLTALVPLKLVPEMVTAVPAVPPAGEKLSIFGRTVKLLVLSIVFVEINTLIRPVVAPAGTMAVI